MKSQILGLRVASVVFGLICLAQLLRIIARISIEAGGCYVPRWISAIVVLVAGALCVWLWSLAAKAGKPPAQGGGQPPA
jgi:uncharacterized membrane protein